MCAKKIARLASRPEDYEALGLKKGGVEAWEDGLHTQGKFGEYEWWYSDVKFSGGGSVVVVFYTGPMTAMQKGFRPQVGLNFTYPDGRHFEDSMVFPLRECSFETERCDVEMKGSYIRAQGQDYVIHYESERVKADIVFKRKMAPWRPETGRMVFDEKNYFAWMPYLPESEAAVDINIEGEQLRFTGTGYHDHNWGDKPMFFLMHHWYWGRAKIGPYQVISSYITARKEYGHEHFTVFLLGRDGEKIADRGDCVRFTQSQPVFDEYTGKHWHKKLEYEYEDAQHHYRIAYNAEDIIERMSLTDSKTVDAAKTNALMRLGMKALKLAPAYIRWTGTASIEKLESGKVVEKYESPALWEMMYFGPDEDV